SLKVQRKCKKLKNSSDNYHVMNLEQEVQANVKMQHCSGIVLMMNSTGEAKKTILYPPTLAQCMSPAYSSSTE
ncbi:hypothetical protein FRX31_025935, partial [Thalictrum thalictroides]